MSKAACRRLVALVAAYAIALQAVVASFAMASAVDIVPRLCTSSGPQTPGPDPRHAQPCIGCPGFCDEHASSAPASGVSALARHAGAVRFGQGRLLPAERSAPRNLPPARAPPRV